MQEEAFGGKTSGWKVALYVILAIILAPLIIYLIIIIFIFVGAGSIAKKGNRARA